MPGPERDDLPGDGHRRLLRRARPDVEADRAGDAREVLVGRALFLQARRAVVVGPAAPHRPDVAGLRRERRLQHGDVELRVVGEDADHGPFIHLRRLQELIRPRDHDLIRAGESLARSKHGPGVANRNPVAHKLADAGDGRSEVYGPEHVHPGRRGEGLDEDRHVLHAALSPRPEVPRLGPATLQEPARRLHHGLVQFRVASCSHVILWRDQQLAPQLRPFDDGRHGHRRLLRQGDIPPPKQLAHGYQSTLSTKMWMIPPHVRPTPKASSSEIPYVRYFGSPLSMAAIASSNTAGSTHPPLTEPAT